MRRGAGLLGVLLVMAALPGSAHALSLDLASQAKVRLDGTATTDHAGVAVDDAGDVNGDGIDDVIVGAPGNDAGGTNAGAAYVVYGSRTPATVDLGTLTAAQGFRIAGAAAGDDAGFGVGGAGDVNGDGYDDVIVGADQADPNARVSAGAAYVVYGAASQANLNLATDLTAARGYAIQGATPGDAAGGIVDGAGDVNGDGYADVIVGALHANAAKGGAYVVYGAPTRGTLDLATGIADGTAGFSIAGTGGQTGLWVDGAGDVNGDAYDDVIIGAPGLKTAYVVFGAASAAPLDLATDLPGRGFAITGPSNAGHSVAGAGDVNGDGYDDVIIGAPAAKSAYVVYGSATPAAVTLTALTPATGFRFFSTTGQTGTSVSSAGDVNGDGYADVLVGNAGAAHNGRSTSGAVYVIYGAPSQGDLGELDLSPDRGLTVDGAAATDTLGVYTGAGDVNGDGRPDLLLGAIGASPHGATSGTAYVVSLPFLPHLAYEPAVVAPGDAVDIRPRLDASAKATLSVSPALPAGLSLDAATGRITGTAPDTPGAATYRVVVSDPLRGGTSASLPLTIVRPVAAPAGRGRRARTALRVPRERTVRRARRDRRAGAVPRGRPGRRDSRARPGSRALPAWRARPGRAVTPARTAR